MAGGALIGIVATVGYVGAKQATIAIAYCDCGFKEQESISQFWALNLVVGARRWLLHVVAIMTAIGVAVAGRVLSTADDDTGSSAMPASWATVAYLAAGTLVVGTILQVTMIGDPVGALISALGTGVLLPIWSFWLARDFRLAPPSDR